MAANSPIMKCVPVLIIEGT